MQSEMVVPQVQCIARQGAESQDPLSWGWVEASVWTERMLAALGNGVKEGKMVKHSSQSVGFSLCMKPGLLRVNPDEETTNWRAVCGRTARTVRRAFYYP